MQQPCSPLLTYFLIYLYKSLLCLESYVQTSLFCACFSFLNSSCNSFIFGLYLSLLLIYEFDQFFDGLFPCLLYLLVRFSERSFPCMFAVVSIFGFSIIWLLTIHKWLHGNSRPWAHDAHTMLVPMNLRVLPKSSNGHNKTV